MLIYCQKSLKSLTSLKRSNQPNITLSVKLLDWVKIFPNNKDFHFRVTLIHYYWATRIESKRSYEPFLSLQRLESWDTISREHNKHLNYKVLIVNSNSKQNALLHSFQASESPPKTFYSRKYISLCFYSKFMVRIIPSILVLFRELLVY